MTTSSCMSQTAGCMRSAHSLGALDIVRVALHYQAVHDERLEQLECHAPGQAALVQLEFWAGDDDRASGVVHALAEQVLPESALLAPEKVGQRLEPVIVAACHRPATPSVIYKRVHRFLEHTLFIAHYDLGRGQVNQPLQAIVPVDDPAI